MTPTATSPYKTIVIESLGLDQGAHLLIKRALDQVPVGAVLRVSAGAPDWDMHLLAWCRANGHAVSFVGDHADIVRGPFQQGRWAGAVQGGEADRSAPQAVAEHAPAHWGLAARGATVEAGSPGFDFRFSDKSEIWAETAADLYQQALAGQWDPETAIDWTATPELPVEVEDAVVQVMTYLIENETVALIVPARFLGRVHPHFREVMQVLAIQVADEARHIEVFTRRAQRVRPFLGLSTAGGQASLHTLLEEPDFALASFLLSVLGEGSFLSLLRFLGDHGPDPITRQVCRLSGVDEARHVAFGLSHLVRHVRLEPALRGSLRAAIERRHGQLQHTAGLNEEVFDALVLMAAGSYAPADLDRGWRAVVAMKEEMDHGRRVRLGALGFSPDEAEALSGLHTRNFM